MSAFQDSAKPAPTVEAAVAEAAPLSDLEHLNVTPAGATTTTTTTGAGASGNGNVDDSNGHLSVEPAKQVGPAVTYDDPKQFAPPITQEEASELSVAALRMGSGTEFESIVSCCCCFFWLVPVVVVFFYWVFFLHTHIYRLLS